MTDLHRALLNAVIDEVAVSYVDQAIVAAIVDCLEVPHAKVDQLFGSLYGLAAS